MILKEVSVTLHLKPYSLLHLIMHWMVSSMVITVIIH